MPTFENKKAYSPTMEGLEAPEGVTDYNSANGSEFAM